MNTYTYVTIGRKLYDVMARRLILFALYHYRHFGEITAVYENSIVEILPNRIIISTYNEFSPVYSFSVV